ncbi:MAG: response regulator transcription factor [Bdellovibrionales bacterium]|nr:response regulator transcription factor [Bdellovibrionales bacterium]
MKSQSLLVIDSRRELHATIRAVLKSKYDVTAALNAKEGYQLLKNNHFDLILINTNLPDENGLDFCERLKNDDNLKPTPFIILSGKDNTADYVRGFEIGAEDYILLPFVKERFFACITARLQKQIDAKQNRNILQAGQLELDRFQQRAFILKENEKIDIQLTPIEFRLLRYFLTHTNQVLTREQILKDIWGDDVSVTDRTVDTHIYTLRKKLDFLSETISTVPGIGYQYQHQETMKAS